MTTNADRDRLLSVDQLAETLGVSRQTVYRLVREGLPHYRIASTLRFDLVEVKAHLRQPRGGQEEG